MKINETIIDQYDEIQRNIIQIIKGFGLSVTYVAHGAGIDRATFYRKAKTRSFTSSELRKVLETINR